MGGRAVCFALFLCVVACLIHRLTGVAAYPARELPSNSLYSPTSMPPTILGAPNSNSNTELQRMMSPPPQPTLGAGSGPISPLPAALPPKSFLPPSATGDLAEAPQPLSPASHHFHEGHTHKRKDPPARENQQPPLPETGPISPLPAALPPKSTLPPPEIEALHPPRATSNHTQAEHAHKRKDSPSLENQPSPLPGTGPISPLPAALPPKSTFLVEAPQPPRATSHHIHEEHTHKREDSPSMESPAPPLLGKGPVSPVSAASPSNSALPPPALGGPTKAPQPPSVTNQQINGDHKHRKKHSPSVESQAPRLPETGPSSPLPSALLPMYTFPPPEIEGTAEKPQPPSATSHHIHGGDTHKRKDSPSIENQAPPLSETAPVPSAPTLWQRAPPINHMGIPELAPATTSDPAVSPISNSPSDVNRRISKIPAAPAPSGGNFNHPSHVNHSSARVIAPVTSAPLHEGPDLSTSNNGTSPTFPPTSFSNPKPPKGKRIQDPAPGPAFPFHKDHAQKKAVSAPPVPAPSPSFHEYHARKEASSPLSAPSPVFPPLSYQKGPEMPQVPSQAPMVLSKNSRHRSPIPAVSSQGPVIPEVPSQAPVVLPKKSRNRSPTPAASIQGPLHSPKRTPLPPGAPMPLSSSTVPSNHVEVPVYPPAISSRKPRIPLLSPAHVLPPPPPNKDCESVLCTDPLTNNPPGAPCRCVMPMKVGLRLGMALLTFFPMVSELAQEVASGVFMNQSQVRIVGANTAIQAPDETDVLLDLVPLALEFSYHTALLVYDRFWHKQVDIKSSFFGDYQVLFVHYPGLPPSPPSALTDITTQEAGQLPNGNPSRTKRPLAADFRKRKDRLDGGLIAFIVLSSTILLALFVGAVWLFLWKQRDNTHHLAQPSQTSPPHGKTLGARSAISGSGSHSPSPSFSSSIAAYAGSAKTFNLSEIEKATNNFDDSTILGEGGFGRVYKGTIEDGTKVAVKVLKRDDHHGGREFLAEVEMLSRLHHRNLVKLIGICTEEHNRCLVYELIPNGSVESHLHGVDKETAPLDWDARLKIALGSARGLAYLHEDSSPRVIHRDFKSSNILLECDFTPKVSDFGLARSALDEEKEHISTRVMGTFGYVAPEYAMTGHLLVKSDVYSYGVVLLELLTGRKPVDMTQPPGQENLVNWARPLLTTKEGLEMIIDPALGPDFPFDSVAKVAAIASMCVQPEVSHRPFMGEVVQALKLVCNECDEKKAESGSYSQEDSSAQETETRISIASGQLPESHSFMMSNYGSSLEAERVLSTSDVFNTSARFARHESASFWRHSSSGPLRTTRRGWLWWRGLSSGSVSEHGFPFKLWASSESRRRLPQ